MSTKAKGGKKGTGIPTAGSHKKKTSATNESIASPSPTKKSGIKSPTSHHVTAASAPILPIPEPAPEHEPIVNETEPIEEATEPEAPAEIASEEQGPVEEPAAEAAEELQADEQPPTEYTEEQPQEHHSERRSHRQVTRDEEEPEQPAEEQYQEQTDEPQPLTEGEIEQQVYEEEQFVAAEEQQYDDQPQPDAAVDSEQPMEYEQSPTEPVEDEQAPVDELQQEEQQEQLVYEDQQPAYEEEQLVDGVIAAEVEVDENGQPVEQYQNEEVQQYDENGELVAEPAVDQQYENGEEQVEYQPQEEPQYETEQQLDGEQAVDEQPVSEFAEESAPVQSEEVAPVESVAVDTAAIVGGSDLHLTWTLRLFNASLNELFARYIPQVDPPLDDPAQMGRLTLSHFVIFCSEYNLSEPITASRRASLEGQMATGRLLPTHDDKHILSRAEIKKQFTASAQGEKTLSFTTFVQALVHLAPIAYAHAVKHGEPVHTGLQTLSEQVKEFFSENLGLYEVQEAAGEEPPLSAPLPLPPVKQPTPRSERKSSRSKQASASNSTKNSARQPPSQPASGRKLKHPPALEPLSPVGLSATPGSPVGKKSRTLSRIPVPSPSSPLSASRKTTKSQSGEFIVASPKLDDQERRPSRLLKPNTYIIVNEPRSPLSPLINTKNLGAKMTGGSPISPLQSRLSPPQEHSGHAIITRLAQQLAAVRALSPTGTIMSEPATTAQRSANRNGYAAGFSNTTNVKSPSAAPPLLPSLVSPPPATIQTQSKEMQEKFLQTTNQDGVSKKKRRRKAPLNDSVSTQAAAPPAPAPAPTVLAPIIGAKAQPALVQSKSLPNSSSESQLGTKVGKKGGKKPIDPLAEEKALEKDLKALNTKLFHQVSLIHARQAEAEAEEQQLLASQVSPQMARGGRVKDMDAIQGKHHRLGSLEKEIPIAPRVKKGKTKSIPPPIPPVSENDDALPSGRSRKHQKQTSEGSLAGVRRNTNPSQLPSDQDKKKKSRSKAEKKSHAREMSEDRYSEDFDSSNSAAPSPRQHRTHDRSRGASRKMRHRAAEAYAQEAAAAMNGRGTMNQFEHHQPYQQGFGMSQQHPHNFNVSQSYPQHPGGYHYPPPVFHPVYHQPVYAGFAHPQHVPYYPAQPYGHPMYAPPAPSHIGAQPPFHPHPSQFIPPPHPSQQPQQQLYHQPLVVPASLTQVTPPSQPTTQPASVPISARQATASANGNAAEQASSRASVASGSKRSSQVIVQPTVSTVDSARISTQASVRSVASVSREEEEYKDETWN